MNKHIFKPEHLKKLKSKNLDSSRYPKIIKVESRDSEFTSNKSIYVSHLNNDDLGLQRISSNNQLPVKNHLNDEDLSISQNEDSFGENSQNEHEIPLIYKNIKTGIK